jgi:hypothetical protein
MEVVIPLFALSSLYLINNQSKQNDEAFQNRRSQLPNVDTPNKNYPQEIPIISADTDQTSQLSTVNKYNNGGGTYTDKYFNPNLNNSSTDATYYSLTGDRVNGSYFEHNNMVPFFGSHLRGLHHDPNATEGAMDNYTGAGSQHITKQEQSPLFSPYDTVQWPYGAPNATDFIQSRVNPGMRMANVKPFADEMVGPGLGLGYGTSGGGGFNSGMMARDQWLDKTVDELRVDNKPRASGISLLGHGGPANSYVKTNATPEQMGVMEKHTPDQSFELGADRLFTTMGRETAPTLRAIPIDRYVSRPETSTDYAGVASYANSAAYIPGEYMPSHHQQLGGVPLAPANASGRYYANDGDFEIQAKKAYPNNRSQNRQDSYFGAVSGGLNAAIAPLLDILRPSRKENVVGTLRPYQNPGTVVPQSYLFNPADKLVTTIRETTEKSKMHMNVNANQLGGAYQVTPQQAANTYRQETGDFYYSGGASAGARTQEMTSYEANYNQRNNDLKSSTIDGRMNPGNMSLLNGDINMRQDNRDNLLKNTRPISGDMPYQSPEIGTMGRLAGNTGNGLYSTIQMDRNTADITSALKQNPFVLDYRNMI